MGGGLSEVGCVSEIVRVKLYERVCACAIACHVYLEGMLWLAIAAEERAHITD